MANTPLNLSLEEDDPAFFHKKIFDILNDVLQPTSTTSLEDAAKALDNLHPDRRPDEPGQKKETQDAFVYWFFEPFHTVAKQIPHQHPSQDKLAELVKTLQNLPSRQVRLTQWGNVELWKDLPLFGHTFSEAFDSDSNKPFDTAVRNQRNLNFQSYGARLMANGTVDTDWYCIRALADTLEGRYDKGKGSHRKILTDPTADPEVDIHVAIAAEWIFHGGHVFYKKGRSVGGDYHGPLVKGPGKGAFSPERWKLWKERWTEFSECDGLSEETRKIARDAALKMEEIERDASKE